MAPLSGSPARALRAKWRRYPDGRLYSQSLCLKLEKIFVFSYNIYDFAINRIYTKNSTICISWFFVGGQVRWEIIFRMWKQKPLQVIAGKKQCAMPSIAALFVIGKRRFLRRFAWSHWHKFSYLQNFDRSWSSQRCFLCRLRAVWAISRSRHQPRSRRRSVSCDRVKVNKPKLWNFDWPLGLPGHLQLSFWCRQRVISSKYDSADAWQQ